MTILIAGFLLSSASADEAGHGWLVFDPESLLGVGLGGLPIAFLGGRALLPAARSGGWRTALAVGVAFGLIAPPLGAIEVVAVGLLPFSGATSGFSDNATGFLLILPLALAYSYMVVVLTVPAGLLWALIVRAIPDRSLERLRIGHED
jgi:ascorbate-specific PTS system EIIC-type component UlaA